MTYIEIKIFLIYVDKDHEENSEVTMAVEWFYNDYISISPISFRRNATVSFFLNKQLDFENRKQFEFKVILKAFI